MFLKTALRSVTKVEFESPAPVGKYLVKQWATVKTNFWVISVPEHVAILAESSSSTKNTRMRTTEWSYFGDILSPLITRFWREIEEEVVICSGSIFELFSGCFCDLLEHVKTVYAMSNETVIDKNNDVERFKVNDSMCE